MPETQPKPAGEPLRRHRPPRAFWWSLGCVMLMFAENETIQKYGGHWPDWLVVALWVLPLIPFGVFFFKREWMLKHRGQINERFWNHPISYSLCVALFLFVCIEASVHSFVRLSRIHPTTTDVPPPSKQEPQQAKIQPQAESKNAKNKKMENTAQKQLPVRRTVQLLQLGRTTQNGTDNQQTVTQAPITQANSGGCNQQVVGGNNNTNNCIPPSRTLTDDQKTTLAEAMSEIPKGIEVVVGSADSGESQGYADQIRNALGIERKTGTFFGWHPKGMFILIHASGDTAELPARHLGFEMKQVGLPVDHVEADPTHAHEGEILIAIGEQ